MIALWCVTATAAVLADAGFVVAALNHPGDNATDRSRTDTLSILLDRPADITRLTDFMLDGWPEASKLDRQRIGLFDFSPGAYTGLVIAGRRSGRPAVRPRLYAPRTERRKGSDPALGVGAW
jgi:predicted dienelactone hydrolase